MFLSTIVLRVKIFPAFYRIRKVSAVFTRAHHLPYPEPDEQSTDPFYSSKFHSNTTLSSTPRSSEWPFPFRFSEQNTRFLSLRCMLHATLIPIDFIIPFTPWTTILYAEYRPWLSSALRKSMWKGWHTWPVKLGGEVKQILRDTF